MLTGPGDLGSALIISTTSPSAVAQTQLKRTVNPTERLNLVKSGTVDFRAPPFRLAFHAFPYVASPWILESRGKSRG